ncbi:hypothetical protein JY651_46170 [Pyxidicoccus parkwayensis]|uniref:Uncharacterized protein n=1 Tax=Pyxidicoccus parkwayensis TaxID=2813578 RepID=A0ABX7NUP8_9BACT|nr:hypothetical protein [Pyxidicoccus parkwaysis]QSQ22428.1 hypothetical protein JY651_46170 [Pyxidicoccus parkwaysis]
MKRVERVKAGNVIATTRKPASRNAASKPSGNPLRASSTLNDGRRELRRGNLSTSSRLLHEATGTEDRARAHAYLGVLKGGLGYLRRPEEKVEWPLGADEDFTQALKDLPQEGTLWRAWTLAQQAEARRVHAGSRFAVMSPDEFKAELKGTTECFDEALKLVRKLPVALGSKAPQVKSWILAHRAAAYVLVCMRSLSQEQLPEAQKHYRAALKGFESARHEAPGRVYPWASIFNGFLVSLRPKVFPNNSRDSTAKAAAEGLQLFDEAVAQSSDPRQRLQDVPEMLRSKDAARQKKARERIQSTLDLIASVQKPLEQALRESDKDPSGKAAQRVEDLLANELSGSNRFITRCLAGMAYYAGHYDDAIRYGSQALRDDPFDSATRYFVASSFLDMKDPLGVPVGQSMQQEMHNQMELLLRMSLHLALRSGPALDREELKKRLFEVGRHVVSLFMSLLPPKDAQGPLTGEATNALAKLLERVRLPEKDVDEKLTDAVMKLLSSLHGPSAGERGRSHFESILFDNLKFEIVTK